MPANLLRILSVPVVAIITLLIATRFGLPATPPLGMYVNVDAGYDSAELTLLDNGRYTYGDDGSVSVEGTYTVTQNEIVFIEYGPADAPCLHLLGRYKWRLEGKVLTLKAVEDPCPTRQYDWGSGLWIKQPK